MKNAKKSSIVPSVVVDASFVIASLETGTRLATALESRDELHAPHLLDLEVAHVIRRAVFLHEVDLGEAERRLDLFSAIRIVRHSHVPHLRRVWDLRENLSAYDAAYVSLAESLDVPLWTRDARLARSSGHTARIEYIA